MKTLTRRDEAADLEAVTALCSDDDHDALQSGPLACYGDRDTYTVRQTRTDRRTDNLKLGERQRELAFLLKGPHEQELGKKVYLPATANAGPTGPDNEGTNYVIPNV